MIRFEFRPEESTLGVMLRPVAEVGLEWNGTRIQVLMYIDSGADISMIPFRVGRALGLRQEANDAIQEISGISGAGVPYIVKQMGLILNETRLNVKVAWALVEEVPMLMGRMDIFSRFRVVFDERKSSIDFEEYRANPS